MSLRLANIVSFTVGGREARLSNLASTDVLLPDQPEPFRSDPNGSYEVGQLYAQYFTLEAPRGRVPLLLWHGGGLTGSLWETKPCGGAGWLTTFLRAGFDVCVPDGPGLGRASWARYPELAPQPLFRSKREAWELFRIGPVGSYHDDPGRRCSFAGQRFPTDAFDLFARGMVPRWPGREGTTQEAYDALVARIGPCVIVAHSSAAGSAFRSAARYRDYVQGIVLVEPSSLPPFEDGPDPKVWTSLPVLCLFGDFIGGSTYWTRLHSRLRDKRATLGALRLRWLDLPSAGIEGNSHCPMLDSNSDSIASIIVEWLKGFDLTIG